MSPKSTKVVSFAIDTTEKNKSTFGGEACAMSKLLKHLSLFSSRCTRSETTNDVPPSGLSTSIADDHEWELITNLSRETDTEQNRTSEPRFVEITFAQLKEEEECRIETDEQVDEEDYYEFSLLFNKHRRCYELRPAPDDELGPSAPAEKKTAMHATETDTTGISSTEMVHEADRSDQMLSRGGDLHSTNLLHSTSPKRLSSRSQSIKEHHPTSVVGKMASQNAKVSSPPLSETAQKIASKEAEHSLVKRASEELLKLLTDPELADELAVECAEKALQRYISPVMKEQELKVITEAEKALEEELLGLDKNIVQRLPKEVDECLSKRARAVAAAETVANGKQSSTHYSLSKHSSLQTQASKCMIEFGYAEKAMLARDIGLPPAEIPNYTSAPCPSQASSVDGAQSVDPEKRENPSRLQAKLSRRLKSLKNLGEAELTAVFDRTHAWLKRSESRVADAKSRKEQEDLKECRFKPTVLPKKPSSPSNISKHDSEERASCTLSTVDAACLRLYNCARELHSKRYRRIDDFLFDEQQALQASSPRARPMPKHIYGESFPATSLYSGFSTKMRSLPSGVEECTFHPKTNVRRAWTIPDRSERSSFWNLDSIGSLPTGRQGDEETGSIGSSNLATMASFESDLAEALEKSRADSFEDGHSAPQMQAQYRSKKQNGDREEQQKIREVKSPEDLLNFFLECPSQNNAFPKSMPLAMGLKEEENRDKKGYLSDSKALELREPFRATERYKLTQFAGDCKLMTDIDFSEFLKRQEYYLLLKTRKIQALRDKKQEAVKLSPGTKRILKDKKAQLEAARSDTERALRSMSNEIMTDNSISPTKKGRRSQKAPFYDKECSFSPRITNKAQKLGPRTIEDLMRRSAKAQNLMETQKLEQEMDEIAQLTFKPRLNHNPHVTSRLNLKHPEAYMEAIRERQQRQQLRELEAEQRREMEELADCTFQPRTSSLPLCIRRELERKEKSIHNIDDTNKSLPVWGYATKLQTTSMS